MLSILIATFGYLLLGVVFILDKYILTDSSTDDPAVYTFYSTAFLVAALLMLPWATLTISGFDWFWAIFSGLTFSFAVWFMFIAFKKGETSHMSPFIGGITTIAIYLVALTVLQEEITQLQGLGIAIMAFATLLLAFERTRKNSGFHIGFIWGAASGILYAVSHASAKYIYDNYDFMTGFIWTRASMTLIVPALLLSKPMRKHLVAVYAHLTGKNKTKKKKKKGGKVMIIIITKLLAIAAVVLIQFAIAVGSVSIVGALAGLQFVFMFVVILLLTKFAPKIFKEYFTKREIAVQTFALLLVTVGYILLI